MHTALIRAEYLSCFGR